MMSREVSRYHRLTVTQLTVYVRHTVKVAKSTPDRCARTHGTPWVSLVDGDVADGIRPSYCERGSVASTPDQCARTQGTPWCVGIVG